MNFEVDVDESLLEEKINISFRKFFNIQNFSIQLKEDVDDLNWLFNEEFSPRIDENFSVQLQKSNTDLNEIFSKDFYNPKSFSFDVELRFQSGLDAINIAPEFGQIESEYYLEKCKTNKKIFEDLYKICYNSGKWKKWIDDINKVSKEQIVMTCCHYVLSEIDFIKNIKIHFPNADEDIKKRINSQLRLLNEQAKNYCI